MYGDATIETVRALVASGVDHMALLMRHSAREFNENVHDLVNPLTDEGRALSRRLGERLPKTHTLRGYASPPERCIETAQLALLGHASKGGVATRVRPVEGLGVFYVLDQMKMFRALQEAKGLAPFVDRWVAGGLARDVVIPADQAARLVLDIVAEKLDHPVAEQQIDLCVTHDLTVHMVRDRLLGASAGHGTVEFLDALAVYRRDGRLMMRGQVGPEREVMALGEG